MSCGYNKMSKEQLLAECARLKREKPAKWKWTFKAVCNELARREGIFERERPKEAPETLGRHCRDPKMIGGVPI
jgi:hypothetical protein